MPTITATPQLQVGAPAPGFDLSDEQGHRHRLSEYRGQTLILCFLPHDTGPAGRNPREHYPGSTLDNCFMLGVMIATPQTAGEFHRRNQAPFPIAADTNAAVSRAYGMMELMAREHHPGYVAIGPDGMVKVVLKHRSSPNHVYELLKRAERKS